MQVCRIAFVLTVCCGVFTASGYVFAAESDYSPEKIDALIKNLGSDDFETRDAAEKELLKAAGKAQKSLETAQNATDAQVKSAAKRILAKIHDDAALGERNFEKEGGFSFQPPKDWSMREFPGFKFKIASAVPDKDFASNLTVVDEKFDGTVAEYAEANIATVSKLFKDFKKLGQDEVTLNSGAKAVRLIITDSQLKFDLRQIFYLVKGTNGKMFVITCTSLAELGDKLDTTFETSAKSFRLEETEKK